ncbi:MAG: pilus assembly protein N-terminal domain-containing protein [Myxococcaceae bacterium]|nr:pilus assembly protein N-terminal domain-containing protein [Myxococcaceae bacterium]
MKTFVRSVLVSLSLFSVPVLASPAQVPAPADTHETLTLRPGGSKVVKAPGMNRLAIGDPEIADIKVPDKGSVRITALKAGETTLVIWSGTVIKTYRLVVEG